MNDCSLWKATHVHTVHGRRQEFFQGGASLEKFSKFLRVPPWLYFGVWCKKITKGPPLVKIFVKILTKNMVFRYRERSEPKKFDILW